MVMGMDKLFFLYRPRKSGKTLTISTLEAIFQGKREQFSDLIEKLAVQGKVVVLIDDYWSETGVMKLMWDAKQSMRLDVTEDLEWEMAKRSLATFDVADVRYYEGDPGKIQALLL